MSHKVTMTFDAERGFLSCLRFEDDEAYKGFAYALEQGVTDGEGFTILLSPDRNITVTGA